jgi:DNA polymerase-1
MYCQWKDKKFEVKWWNGERLRNTWALDTETEWIVNEQTPKMIIGQAFDGDVAYLFWAKDTEEFLKVNLNYNTKAYFQNFKFDMAVTELEVGHGLWEQAVDSGRILDIGILYRLVRLAQMGISPRRYNLAEMTMNLHRVKLNKDPLIRGTFGDGDLTDEHIQYAALDAIATFFDAKSLIAQTYNEEENGHRKFLGHRLQLQGDLAIGDMQRRPVNVDLPRAKQSKKDIERAMLQRAQLLVAMGYNPTLKGNTARYTGVIKPILEEAGIPLRWVGKKEDSISQSSAYLMPVMTHPFVENFIAYSSDQKLLTTFFKPLVSSGGQVYPRYELLMATGRTSCSKPNIQQQPRIGGARECIIPPEAMAFLGADYSYIELCTLAQWLYNMYGGERELCRVINSGQDPHKATASLLLNKSLDQITKDERQTAKALNFGIPGGLSAESLRGYAKLNYDVDLSDTEAEEWRNKWLYVYPDVEDYLEQYWSDVVMPCGRKRAECQYTVAHNTPFQGLASDGIKTAMYQIYREGQIDMSIMIHDELICSVPLADSYNDQADYLEGMMIKGMQEQCPNVMIKAEAVVTDKWLKGADPRFDGSKLICTTEEYMLDMAKAK